MARCAWHACSAPAARQWTTSRSCGAPRCRPCCRCRAIASTLEYDGHAVRRLAAPDQRPLGPGSARGRYSEIHRRSGQGDGAGRTDAGVHAAGQVVHFDLAREFPVAKICDALNGICSPIRSRRSTQRACPTISTRGSRPPRGSIAIASCCAGAAGARAHPRLACRPRSTRTRCTRRRSAWSAGTTSRASAPACAGEIAGEDARPARRRGGGRRDPYHRRRALVPAPQVRNMCGHLEAGREGKWTADDVAAALAARERRAAVRRRRRGLCLMAVGYARADRASGDL